jgi:hypothetical protein
VDLTLKGNGTISLSGTGSLFAVTSGAALALDGSISENTASGGGVFVDVGTFTLDLPAAQAQQSVTGNSSGNVVNNGGTIRINGSTAGGW